MRSFRTVAALSAVASMMAGMPTTTYTMPSREPHNRGRRADKDAAKIAKADEKRKRRAAKRLAQVNHDKG